MGTRNCKSITVHYNYRFIKCFTLRLFESESEQHDVLHLLSPMWPRRNVLICARPQHTSQISHLVANNHLVPWQTERIIDNNVDTVQMMMLSAFSTYGIDWCNAFKSVLIKSLPKSKDNGHGIWFECIAFFDCLFVVAVDVLRASSFKSH